MGKKSAHMKIENGGVGEGEMYAITQEVKVPFTGIYTASAYVKTKNMKNAHVRLSLKSEGVRVPVYSDTDGGKEIFFGEDDEGAVEEGDDENPGEDKDEDDADEDSSAEEAGIDENTPAEINDGYRRIQSSINVKKEMCY